MRHELASKSMSRSKRASKSTFGPGLRRLRRLRRFFQISPTYARTHTCEGNTEQLTQPTQTRSAPWCDRAAVVRVGRMTGQADDGLQGGSAGGGGSFPGGRPSGGRRRAVFHALQQKSDQESVR